MYVALVKIKPDLPTILKIALQPFTASHPQTNKASFELKTQDSLYLEDFLPVIKNR